MSVVGVFIGSALCCGQLAAVPDTVQAILGSAMTTDDPV